MTDTVEAILKELETSNSSFHIKWSYLSKRYLLTIPWLDLEFDGKTLLDVLQAWKQQVSKE